MLRRWAMDEITWKMFWIWLELNNLLLIYSGTLHLYVFVHVLYMYLLRYCTRECVCVCVYIRRNARARLFSILLVEKGDSFAPPRSRLQQLSCCCCCCCCWDQEEKKNKKCDRICSEQLPLQISCDSHESYLYKWDLEYVRRLELLDSAQLAAWDPHWSQAAACSDQLLLNPIGNLVLVV